MRTWLSNLGAHKHQRGQGFIEYAFLLVLIAATAVGSVSALGGGVSGVYQQIICWLGEGGAECGCEWESITSGPSYTCVGGVFAAQAYTSCGVNTALSIVVEAPNGDSQEIPLTLDEENEIFSVVHNDTSGLCATLEGPPPGKVFLVSRQNDGVTINSWRIDAGAPVEDTGGSEDDEGGEPGEGGSISNPGDDEDDESGEPGEGGTNPGDDGSTGPGTGENPGTGPGTGENPGGQVNVALTASPLSLNFGDVNNGASTNQTITLTHNGASGAPALTVSGIAVTGSHASDFSVLFDGAVILNAGESRSFNVIFAPTAVGSRSASLTVLHDGQNSPLNLPLSGNGVQVTHTIAMIVLSTNLSTNDTIIKNKIESFGYQVQPFVQSASASTVLNTNPAAIVISESITSGSVNTKFRDTDVPVMVHEGYLVDDMQLSNAQAWVDQQSITIVNSSHPITSGYSGSVRIVSSTSQMTAGNAPSGATVLANSGGKAVLYIANPGDALWNSYLAAGRRAVFPMGEGMASNTNATGWALYQRTLDWLVNGGGSGGGNVPTANATISVSPTSIDFASVAQGNTAQWNVTITNSGPVGAAPLTISGLSITGDNASDFTLSQAAPLVLERGQSTQVMLTFQPGAVGSRSATLVVAHDGSNTSPVNVPITGTATTPPPSTLGVSVSSLNFGNTSQGQPTTQTIRLTNTGAYGALPITISALSLGGSHTGDFSVSPAAPITLAQGQPQDITVTFSPTATGNRSATLNIAHDGSNASPVLVSLTGAGTPGASRIALIVRNKNRLSSYNDNLLVNLLENDNTNDYEVTTFNQSQTVNIYDYDLIVISASVNSSNFNVSNYRNASIPIVVLHSNVAINLGMGDRNSAGIFRNGNIQPQGNHAIINGRWSWMIDQWDATVGYVSAANGATVLATNPSNSSNHTLFIFDSGFAARRGAFLIPYTTYPNVNENGQLVFRRLVAWALGVTIP